MKDLDLGTDDDYERRLGAELTRHPCFGGCGKTWDESGGGWQEFEEGEDGRAIQGAPAWYCDECFAGRSSGAYPTAVTVH